MRIKGGNTVTARRLLAVVEHQPHRRTESTLVGRTWELATISGILDEAIGGSGCVVNIVGTPGIGKSRLVRETAPLALGRGVPVFSHLLRVARQPNSVSCGGADAASGNGSR